MIENRAKRILREGGMAIGTYAGCFGEPAMVEIIGHAGFDAVFIDMEHNALDLREVQMMVLAAERVGITPIVRPPGFEPALILRLLDVGVQGIYVPDVAGAAGARAAVEAVRYPPLGERGMIGYSRASDYGKVPLVQHMERSNREVLLAVMVEGLQALDEVDAIAATEGVDLVAVGPSDLSRALGIAGDVDHPKLVAAIDHIAAAVARNGNVRLAMPVGHSQYPRSATQLKALGVGYATCGPAPEVRLLRSLSQQASELRRELGRQD